MKPRRTRTRIALSILLVIAGLGVMHGVYAGPVTNSDQTDGRAPFTKLGIYQKVLRIVDTSGAWLEFGNRGRDIISSGDIIFRPTKVGGAVTASENSVRVTANSANSADLYIPGDLCLYDHANGLLKTCKHILGDGSGSTLWQEGDDPLSSIHFLQAAPILNQAPGLHIGTSGSPITGKSAVTLSGGGSSISAQNRGTGDAADFQGTVTTGGLATIFGQLQINSREVWHPAYTGVAANDGVASKHADPFGLDADLANGNQVTIEVASSCTESGDGFAVPHAACLCFTEKYTNQAAQTCVGGNNAGLSCTSDTQCSNGGGTCTGAATGQFIPVSITPVKHCIDLGNRF